MISTYNFLNNNCVKKTSNLKFLFRLCSFLRTICERLEKRHKELKKINKKSKKAVKNNIKMRKKC